MSKPLEGLRVVEVSMWAFGPSAGALLSDMGADVIKLESPGGDPIRQLTVGNAAPGAYGFAHMWEIFNRGKRGMTVDLSVEGATELLHRLLGTADVFLTTLLPATRQKFRIDVDDITPRHPNIIYAIGSGQGAFGPDAEAGGFDVISYWGRSGIASSVTPDDHQHPLAQPGPAFGDGTSGAIFAGGIAAAIAQRAMTGKASVVDCSLLATGMWAVQPGIVGSKLAGVKELPKTGRTLVPNPLVNAYRTSDGRYLSLCMLQSQRYWPGLCAAIGRPDLEADPRFDTDQNRKSNLAECISILDEVFATKTLAEWESALSQQSGQWGVLQKVGELPSDPQVLANNFVQDVVYSDGRKLTMVSTPVQYDREVLRARPAPEMGEHNDEILTELGFSESEIIDFKVTGIVY